MPHTTTKIYASGGIGVDLRNDVNYVLGISTEHVSYACSNAHGKTNKWAKFKPERIAGTSALTLTRRKANNFGLTPGAVYSGKASFVNAVKNGTFNAGWAYLAPRQDIDDCRIGDFDGYDSLATSPFGSLVSQTFILQSSTTNQLVVPAAVPVAAGDESSIHITEFSNVTYPIKDWYFGILLYHSSRNFMATVTTPFTTSEDWQVNFGWINPSYAGTYKGVPFLSNKPMTVSGAEPSGLVIMGIGNPGVNIILKTITDQYAFFATCMYPNEMVNTVSYEVSITNTTSTSKQFTAVTLQVASSFGGANATTLKSFGTVTVPANSTWRQSGSATLAYSGIASNLYQFCRLTATGVTNTNWINFEASPDVEPDAEAG